MKKYKLKELINVKRGMSLSGMYYSAEGNLIRLTLGNFQEKGGFKINTSKDDLFFTGPVREEFILSEGDIITPLTEQVVGLLGATARVPESGKYIQSGDVALIKCISDKLDDGYCYYLISSDLVRRQLSVAAQQTKIRHTSPEKIMDCEVFIPEVNEQRKIANLLDAINKKIELNNKINDNLAQYVSMIFDYWFTQFDFPNSTGKPYKSSGGTMIFSSILGKYIPEGWNIAPLGNIAKIRIESITPKAGIIYKHYSIPAFDDSKLPKIEDGSAIDSSKYAVPSNTVLVSKLNPQFKRIWFINGADDACICSTEFIPFCSKTVPLEYLYGILNSASFHRYMIQCSSSSTGSRKRMPPELCLTYNVILPPKEIMEAFSNRIKSSLTHMSSALLENQTLKTTRNQLLPLLMSGQAAITD